MSRLLTVAALVAVVAVVSVPDALAQCGAGARSFNSVGGGMTATKARFDDSMTNQAGDLGRFWDPNNSAVGNNWGFEFQGAPVNNAFKDPRNPSPIDGGTEGLCESSKPLPAGQQWWTSSQTTLRATTGAIAASGCFASACPAADLTYLMEECGTSGCGTGGTSFYISSTTSRFHPASTDASREWDTAVPFGGVDSTTTLLEFPSLQATNSGKVGNDTLLTVNLGRASGGGAATDAGDSVFVNSSNAPTTADSYALVSVDILEHAGPSDPGRERFAGCGGGTCVWTQTGSAPYADTAIGGVQHLVDCGDRTADIWVAAGLTFQGGGGANDVQSLLVGQAVLVQCDPQTADPRPIRPKATGRQAPDGRTPTGRSR